MKLIVALVFCCISTVFSVTQQISTVGPWNLKERENAGLFLTHTGLFVGGSVGAALLIKQLVKKWHGMSKKARIASVVGSALSAGTGLFGLTGVALQCRQNSLYAHAQKHGRLCCGSCRECSHAAWLHWWQCNHEQRGRTFYNSFYDRRQKTL